MVLEKAVTSMIPLWEMVSSNIHASGWCDRWSVIGNG